MKIQKEKSASELLLTSIYQNAQTAIQSLNDILSSVKEDALASEISKQESEYTIISKECEILAKSERINLKNNNLFEKIRLWTSIKINTCMDKSASHITEMLLFGTFMGLITCIKDEIKYASADEEILNLLKKLKTLEENNIESLKNFL